MISDIISNEYDIVLYEVLRMIYMCNNMISTLRTSIL